MIRRLHLKKEYLIFSISVALYILLFACSRTVKAAATQALDLCAQTLVPTLFPTLFLCAFFTKNGFPEPLKNCLRIPLAALTGLTENAAENVIFGATGGYPIGIKTAAAMCRSGRILPYEARRCALINVNPGLSFCILVTGKTFFNSTKTGVMLYVCVTLGNALLALILKILKKEADFPPEIRKDDTDGVSFSNNFISSAEDAVKNTFSMCGWILLFYAFSAPLRNISLFRFAHILLEVTCAAKKCAEAHAFVKCAFSLGFGGLCILFQLLPELRSLQVSPFAYLAARTVAGAFSAAFAFTAQLFFGDKIMANASLAPLGIRHSSTPAGTAALLFFAAVFILSVYGDRSGKKVRRTEQ